MSPRTLLSPLRPATALLLGLTLLAVAATPALSPGPARSVVGTDGPTAATAEDDPFVPVLPTAGLLTSTLTTGDDDHAWVDVFNVPEVNQYEVTWFRSADRGRTWTPSKTYKGGATDHFDAFGGGAVLARGTGGTSVGGGEVETTDDGVLWTVRPELRIASAEYTAARFSPAGDLWIAGSSCDTGGRSVVVVDPADGPVRRVTTDTADGLEVLPLDAERAVAAPRGCDRTRRHTLLWTEDGGATWTDLDPDGLLAGLVAPTRLVLLDDAHVAFVGPPSSDDRSVHVVTLNTTERQITAVTSHPVPPGEAPLGDSDWFGDLDVAGPYVIATTFDDVAAVARFEGGRLSPFETVRAGTTVSLSSTAAVFPDGTVLTRVDPEAVWRRGPLLP